jgi:hypothetical protein
LADITVLRPDETPARSGDVDYAKRGDIPAEGAHVILIENGKPRARDLMQFVAEELRQRQAISGVEVFSKPSAGKPIEALEAKEMAARAHLVITGVGD